MECWQSKGKMGGLNGRTVELVPYDPRWPQMFRLEAVRLRSYLPEAGRIEHFGSTAVEGMMAKPVIDILLEVEEPSDPHVRSALERAGYQWYWRTDRDPHYPFCVRFGADGRRTHHVHVHGAESVFWDRILFRDLLRLDEDERTAYERVKLKAAALHPGDREAYTQEKSAYVGAAMIRARLRFIKE